ncbi:MAG: DUF1905 domain-containing protein [Saprospiraceae bacterium]|nr:DUF1905 domain-containing protein [Saprospiraceae bacterium]
MESPADFFEFQSTLEISTNKLWGGHFAVPSWVLEAFASSEDKRVVCQVNDAPEFQCAMLPVGDHTYVVSVNKKLRDHLKLKPGSKVDVKLRKDESVYGLPMPEEMAEVLAQDAEGNSLFHALTPGKIRTLLYIAGNVKSAEKRIFRAIAIVNHLKANKGKIDYKQLNLDLKAEI